jgi:hypothetical protein
MTDDKPDPDKPFRPPVGRPSGYEPEFCDRAIYCGRSGFSFAQIAADLGVTRLQLYNWAAAHKPFLNALLLARDLSLAWWEHQGQKGLWAGKEFNDRVMKFSMTNRFPDDYKERVEVSPGLAKINWDAMTDEQLARVAAGEHPYAVLAETRQIGSGAPQEVGAVATEVDGIPVEPSIGQRLQAGARAARALDALAHDDGPGE